MKKLLCVVLALMLCFSVGATTPLKQKAIAETGAENFEYTVTNNEVTITGVIYSEEFDSTDIVIPETINGYTVTAIGDFAFENCGSINGYLECIEIPDSVTKIGEGAFYNCSSLWSVKLPENLKQLGSNAFSGCSSLDAITIPEGITKIPNNCFAGCESLSIIDIPESVAFIEVNAFKDTYYVQSSSNWDEDVLYLSNHIIATSSEDDYYYEDEIQPYSYTIKEGTKSISSSAFANNKNFSEIFMPDSIKYIGEAAFDSCTNLTSVTLSKGLTEISRGMFGGCTALESITIPEGVKAINDSAFTDCTSLKTVSIPDNVEVIGGSTFYGCTSLSSVEFPDKLSAIGSYAFYDCTSLSSISLSDSLNSIGSRAFYNTAYYNNSSNWINYGYEYSYDDDYYYDDYYDYSYYYDSKALYIQNCLIDVVEGDKYDYYTFEVKDDTRLIADGAFYGCYYLDYVTMPDSVLTIGKDVFSSCNNLREVTLSNNITEIPDYAFNYCYYLESVTLPTSVKKIGNYAFYECGIESITIHEGVTEIGDCAFAGVAFWWNFELLLPDSLTKIGKSAFSGITNYEYDETGMLYVGNHLLAIDKYNLNEGFENGILEIKEGILTIADEVFSYFSDLEGLIIPKSVKNIGNSVALGADALKVVCYMGSEEEWNNINIGKSNEDLLSAKRYYNFEHFTPGDINGDTVVELTDVVALAQYVAEWKVTCNEFALNVNGDTAIDLLDVVCLAQFVAEWEIELAPEIVIPKDEISDDSSSGKYNAFNNSNESTIYNNAPEGTIHVLMWRTFHKSEELLVDQYEKLTGNKVRVTVTTEQEYNTKLVSMVSGGNSPDVICFSAGAFPGIVTKALQPLQNKYFQLDSDCWNKAYMDAYKINGVYFGVAQPKSWSCESSTYVTYYSPRVLKNCGITTTPYQLYKQGRWDWKAQSDIANKVKEKGFTGLSVQSYDLFMLSAGTDFVKYDGSKYTNMLGSVKSSDMITKAWQEAATLKQNNVLTGWDLNNVQQGKVGLFNAISYGLYNEGNWFQTNFAKDLEAVPVAGPQAGITYTPVRPMVWGVPKKAKNPEGAAYFLRYFLDTSAFDFDSTFHNNQFKEVYNTITASSAKKTVMHGSGVTDYVESGTYSKVCNALVATSPQNITTQLNSMKGSVQTGIARANKDLARIKKSS